ncbi:MAG TPA: hypothetical protein VJ858_01850, partial [Acidimicrobiia bacterium]|nr:hypothetical protein [Acidimicrobiia bacterium]
DPGASDPGGGLLAWRSSNGVDWEPLGEVIGPEHTLNGAVVADAGELLALESDETGTGFFLWRSENGADWTREHIELDRAQRSELVIPSAIGGNGDIYVVTGSYEQPSDDVAAQRLSEAVGDLIDREDYGWGIDPVGDDITFTVYGPFGFPLVTYSADELALNAAEREQIVEYYHGSPQQPIFWRSTDDGGWQEAAIEGIEWVDRISSTPTGRLMVHGNGPTGPRLFTSTDGVAWEPSSEIYGPYTVQAWGDLMVGPSGLRGPSVMVSSDGDIWEDIGPATQFPNGIDWYMDAVGSGPGGIAAHVSGFPIQYQAPRGPQPVVLVDEGGAEVTFDFSGGTIEMRAPDGDTHVWSLTGLDSDEVTVDLASGEMAFLDEATGEKLADFDIDELMTLESKAWGHWDEPEPFDALVFTPDGSTWSIQDFQRVAADSYFPLFGVSETHVIAVRVADDFDPGSTGGFEVWAAEIP